MPLRPPSSLDTLKPVFGWWGLDPEGPTLVNKASGQRIRYVGTVRPDFGSLLKPWHRFDYEDDEVRYPVLARVVPRGPDEWISQDERTACMARKDPAIRDAPVLRIDHNLSADLWRAENDSPSEDPAYGLWRRIDDCIMDAFPCCLRFPPTGQFISAVLVSGGWLNSRWHVGFRRSIPVLEESEYGNWASPEPVGADCPFIMSATEPPPSPWLFHSLSPQDEGRLDPDHWYLPDLERRYRFLPTNELVPRFQRTVPYLQSEDGHRVIYPCWVTPKHVTHAESSFGLQYVDDHLIARISAANKSLENPTDWIVNLSACTGESRKQVGSGNFWIQSRECLGEIPTFSLWRRMSWAVNDAWLHWGGTSIRSSHWMENLTLAAVRSLQIRPVYMAGNWLRHSCFAGINDRIRSQ